MELQEVKTKTASVIEEADKLEVKNDEGMKRAIDILAMIKNRIKFVESKRKERTQPINKSLGVINKDFKTVSEPLVEAKNRVEDSMRNYRGKVAEENAKNMLANKDKIVTKKAQVTVSEKSSVRVKMVAKFEVEDFEKVPRKFLKIDEPAIRRELRNGVIKIEGLRIWEDEEFSSYR